MSAWTDAIDEADREIDRAQGALSGAKWQMMVLERTPKAERAAAGRKVLAELDEAVEASTAARKHIEGAL